MTITILIGMRDCSKSYRTSSGMEKKQVSAERRMVHIALDSDLLYEELFSK